MKNLKPLLLALLAGASTLIAADLPPLTLPAGVGINIHFTRGRERDLDMIADAGFKFIRMDFGWAGIERKKGEYDWSAYDELTANLEKRGLRAVYILDYSNGLYEDAAISHDPITGKERRDTCSPRNPESVAAFARWAAAAATHFRTNRIVWEIWNEPNISFWKPKPNAQDYAALALATCKAIRAVEPNATIIAPGSSGFPWTFFEDLFKAGALEYLDAVSVHPYRSYSKGPETAADDYLRLKTLIERYAPAAKKGMPIISGEWGYATHAKGGVTLETQAAFIARQQIANVWQQIPISIWYDWKNDGTDPNYNEHNFGIVSNNLALKPAYAAVRTLANELKGFRVAHRLALQSSNDFAFLLVDGAGKQKIAAWTAGTPHNVTIASEENVSLQAAPVYMEPKRPIPALQAAAAWNFIEPVAVSVEAGNAKGLTVPLQVSNVFDAPVKVQFALTSAAGRQEKSVSLTPRQVERVSFSLSPRNRSAGNSSYSVEATFLDTSGKEIGKSVEQRSLSVANPLGLSVAPIQNGLRLMVQNPSGNAFQGVASVNGQRLPIHLANGATETMVSASAPASAASGATAALLDDAGKPVIDPVAVKYTPLNIPGFKTSLDGDSKVPATATVAESAAPGDDSKPASRAFRLDYSFDAGWRFVRAVAKTAKPVALPGRPAALGMWVYGDKSGNVLRTRVSDAQGQTFQPSGPNLDWSGWKWVQFDLTELSHAGHWGGANDGVAHGGLTIDSLLLVDGSRKKTSGTIYFAGPAAIY